MLEHALAIEKYRNFHVAAKALELSQSTLSRSIHALETELGVTLFNRARGLEPTEFGRFVLMRSRSILNDAENMKDEVTKMRGLVTGEISIGCGPVISQTWIGDAIARLTAKHPGLTVHAKDYSWWALPEALREREIDIAVGETADLDRDPELVVEPLPKRAGVFCCRKDHPLAARKSVTLDEIAAFPLAAPKLPGRIAEFLPINQRLGALSADRGHFVPRVCCENLFTVLRVVAQTDAVGAAVRAFVEPEIAAGRIVALPYEAPWMRTNYGLIYLRNRTLSVASDAFRAAAVSAEKAYFERTPPTTQVKTGAGV
jgi:DNA-binding transcriptional LysR family regulator